MTTDDGGMWITWKRENVISTEVSETESVHRVFSTEQMSREKLRLPHKIRAAVRHSLLVCSSFTLIHADFLDVWIVCFFFCYISHFSASIALSSSPLTLLPLFTHCNCTFLPYNKKIRSSIRKPFLSRCIAAFWWMLSYKTQCSNFLPPDWFWRTEGLRKAIKHFTNKSKVLEEPIWSNSDCKDSILHFRNFRDQCLLFL